uniref:RNA binding motif protein 25 n=1 Tax=Kryptolebias marmoratus TaxID=37003 RepID=A0A3Q3AXQ5_KRYMA
MGVVTPAPTVLVPTTVALVQNPVSIKRDPSIRSKDPEDGGGPTTTVFVGNISEKASDMLVRQLLAKCGIVLSWKRVQGASGKLQAFGFCEYKEPESTLRALRLLHELLLGDRKLLVKVDAKTKGQLDEWKAKKRNVSKNDEGGGEEVLDEETLRRDQVVKGAIDVLIREYSSELNAPSQDSDGQTRNKKRKEKKEEDINAMELEDDKRDLISREISKFRDTHKKLEEEKGKKEKERLEIERERRERDKERERERERRDREKEKEREREKEKERERDRERERERDREREKTKERERSRDISEARSKSRSVGDDVGLDSYSRETEQKPPLFCRERTREDKKRDRDEDEEDIYERRRLERRLRDKEAAYQERLKNWEIREKKKAREYSKETEREDERRREMMKEAKRLKEFLEDYDDDRDDPKYYRGSALQKRLRDREKEIEMDERDRKREKEELEEIRQRLLAEGHPDPDAELQRIEEEAERRRQPVEPKSRGPQQHSDEDVDEGQGDDYRNGEDSQETKPQLKPIMRPINTAPSVSSASGNVTPNTPGVESPCGIIIPGENTPDVQPLDEHRPKIGLSLKLGATNSPSQLSAVKRKKLAAVDSVFNKFDDEEADEQPRKRKLVPLDYGDDDKNLGLDGADISAPKSSINTEEKHKHIKSLIEKIPTSRPELFSYSLDWAMVDSTLMDRRIRPWINKKIIEYIGEEEPTLVDFVCSKIMAHSSPQGILDDVAMVLDEEAEVFIVKMWRLLIYETEAKKIGLVK